MRSKHSTVFVVVALFAGVLVGGALVLGVVNPVAPGTIDDPANDTDGPDDEALADLEQFGDAEAFQEYVLANQGQASTYVARTGAQASGGDAAARDDAAGPQATPVPEADTPGDGNGASEGTSTTDGPDRVGETNVQVAGLDEPDRVKTDGTHFYYAPGRASIHPPEPVPDRRTPEGDRRYRRPPQPDTHVIDASDPADPAEIGAINDTGRLLQHEDTVVVLGNREITGYDVSDPSDPVEQWSKPLNGSLVTARERGGTVYLVTRTRVGPSVSCPLKPLGSDDAVACGDVYRPGKGMGVDATYSAFVLDATDGAVADQVSFVGTADDSAVYMSENALYVTYTTGASEADMLAEFLTEEFEDTPAAVESRIREIRTYDISERSKVREIVDTVDRWLNGMSDERRRTVESRLSEGLSDYKAERQRELTTTGIVRVTADETDLEVAATGTVPGEPLDQFSLDEYEGTLRITTTIPRAGDAESMNDLYTLDAESLDRLGSETGMGEDQRVYSVRYVDDTAYVVTFRRIDPFHVIDVSDPSNPVERGELELPGFSSYLHPIDDDHVLGIGEEDGKVKTVLFDVSDPTNPTIADDKILDDRFSAVSETHHAFTIDRRHGVFFLPAGDSAVIMDYTNGSLEVVDRAETDSKPERTRYVDDYLYVFAGDEIAVYDQTTWERTNTLLLDQDSR